MTITTKQLLEASGVKSVRTLQRWRELNLVPPPSLQRHPTGRGMTWMWPRWTIGRVAEIRSRLAHGESLDQLAQTLSHDWSKEAQRWIRKRYDLAAVIERGRRDDATDRFEDWLSETVYRYFRNIGIERPGRIDEKIAGKVVKRGFMNEVIDLISAGFTPVLVVTEDAVTLTADFALGSALATLGNASQLMTVVPIRDAFVDAFAEVEPDLSKVPKYLPLQQVVEREEGGRRTRNYCHENAWKISLE